MLVYKFEVVFLFLFFQTGTSADNYYSCDHSDLSQQFLFGSVEKKKWLPVNTDSVNPDTTVMN